MSLKISRYEIIHLKLNIERFRDYISSVNTVLTLRSSMVRGILLTACKYGV